MKAEEYFNQSRFVSSSFIEITKTGFRSDMPNVFAFAEEYSESQLKAERERSFIRTDKEKIRKFIEFYKSTSFTIEAAWDKYIQRIMADKIDSKELKIDKEIVYT